MEAQDNIHLYLHFAEIQELYPDTIREFSISWNGNIIIADYRPPEFMVDTIPIRSSTTCDDNCYLQLVKTNQSNYPPSINAMEIFFRVLQLPQSETAGDDGLLN